VETRFGRNPYLQRVRADEATIVWTSTIDSLSLSWQAADAGDPQVRAAEVDASAQPAKGKQYFARITGLRPATLYCYEFQDNSSAQAPLVFQGGFRTAPAPGSTVRFSAMGDVGKDSPDQRAVLQALTTLPSDFLLLLGDLAYDSGTLAQYEAHFFAVYQELLASIPVFPASGNHDYATDTAAAFREVFLLPAVSHSQGDERWYSFDWGPLHIAVLDTEVLLDEQALWLREDLAATTQPWKLVALHKPPYSSGAHGSEASVREILVPVFREQKVHLVLSGHDHDYERSYKTDGVHYIVSGGGGRGTRAVDNSVFTAFAARVAHFVYVVADANTLTLHAIDATGQEFDTLQLVQ
jgi:phosphodiesterase/alkaline phosphatase D-like protein